MVPNTLSASNQLLVGIVYRSPSSDDNMNNQFNCMITEAVARKTSHILLIGDCNYPEIIWSDHSSTATDGHPSHDFLSSIQDCFLYQHIDQPTRFRLGQQANVLDLVFSNEEAMVSDIHLGAPLGGSDHVTIQFKFNCHTVHTQPRFEKYFYKDGNFPAIRTAFNSVDWVSLFSQQTVDNMW